MMKRIILTVLVSLPMFPLLPACQTSDTRYSATDESGSEDRSRSNSKTGEDIEPGDTKAGMATEGR